MNTQFWIILIGVVIVAWFALGMIYNLRRGDAILKWLRRGLPGIGPKTTFRWLGTSVVEMSIQQAKRPFRRLDTLLVLAPRDVFWMMLMARLQGREDFIIFRGHLYASPPVDLELVDPKSWSGRMALKQARSRNWESRPYGELQLMAPRGQLDLAAQTLDHLHSVMDELSPRYLRFSLRHQSPHLEIHLPFPNTRTVDAQVYFEALRTLAQRIAERPASNTHLPGG